MSEWLIAAMKIGFLALLWIFVLLVANTVRTDLFGRPVTASGVAPEGRGHRRSHEEQPPAPRGPRALRVLDGRQEGLEIPLGNQLDIGRAAESRFVLDDDYCSTHHAVIRPASDGGFYVEDFGSTNGTFVNESRITAPTLVGPDDVIRIGRTSMKLVA